MAANPDPQRPTAADVEDSTAHDDVAPESAFAEIGMVIEAVDDEMHGRFDVVPELRTPGTDAVRASVAAAVADAVLGFHAIRALSPRLPVTLELDVHLFDEVAGAARIHGRSRVVKAGQSVIVTSMDFLDDADRLVGFGSASFMAIPNPEFTAPDIADVLARFGAPTGRLTAPIAERIGCVRTAPGVVTLPCTPIVHNGSKAINGGLLAVAVEEAALSADPAATRIESLHIRFVRAVRVGPATARADVHHGMARVEVVDESSGAVAAIATTRSSTLG